MPAYTLNRHHICDLYMCVRGADIDILQKGNRVDPDNFKGPIRLRIAQGKEYQQKAKDEG